MKQAYRVADKSLKYVPVIDRDEVTGMQLLIGPSMSHFGTTSTFAPAVCEVEPEAMFQISADDANEIAVREGEKLKVTGTTGVAVVARVRISANIPKGLVYATTNFSKQGFAGLLADGDNQTPIQVERA